MLVFQGAICFMYRKYNFALCGLHLRLCEELLLLLLFNWPLPLLLRLLHVKSGPLSLVKLVQGAATK